MEDLGFRKMSPEKYAAWVQSMEAERSQQLAKIK